MESTRVIPITEVKTGTDCGETLCFQEAVYKYPDAKADVRFRFIRRDFKGNLKAQRGQAGIDTLPQALELIISMAEEKNLRFPATLIWRLQRLVDTSNRAVGN